MEGCAEPPMETASVPWLVLQTVQQLLPISPSQGTWVSTPVLAWKNGSTQQNKHGALLRSEEVRFPELKGAR